MVSGLLVAMTVLTNIASPLTAYAAEPDDTQKKPPVYEEVKDQLDEDEVVTASDYTVAVGSGFDVERDFTVLFILFVYMVLL